MTAAPHVPPLGRLVGGGVLALLVLAGVALLGRAGELPGRGPDCSLVVAGEVRGLSRAQAKRLTTLAGVAQRDGTTQDRLAVAVGAALEAPETAVRAVEALAAVPVGRQAAAAQVSLARALLGFGDSRLSCSAAGPDVPTEAVLATGLTPRAAQLRQQVDLVFGDPPVGGFQAGGVTTGHIAGSAHYDGRALDVFFRPISTENRRRGWATAQWAVAHADELGLATVIFDRRLWTRARADEGWRDYAVPDRPGDPAILAHLDHVHLDVLRGD